MEMFASLGGCHVLMLPSHRTSTQTVTVHEPNSVIPDGWPV